MKYDFFSPQDTEFPFILQITLILENGKNQK